MVKGISSAVTLRRQTIVTIEHNRMKSFLKKYLCICIFTRFLCNIYATSTYNLFVTSKNKTMNSPIHQLCCIKARKLLKLLVNGVLFHIYYIKRHSKPCLFILKALKDILRHFKLVNWRIHQFVVSFF